MVSIPSTFKVYEYTEPGDFLDVVKLNPQATHKPLQPEQVRVKVLSVATNPADYVITPTSALIMGRSPSVADPVGVGFDLSGVVVEVGGGEVNGLRVGDAVYGTCSYSEAGSFSEYARVDAKLLAPKPTNMTFNEAAGVPAAAQTTFEAMMVYGKLSAGQRVLILGGSSACGLYAIQIAKATGAEVITTCSSRNAELVKSVGADQAIDYTTEKWGEVLAPHSVDLIYDCNMEPASWNDAAQTILKEKTGIFSTINGAFKIKDPVESPIGATLHEVINTPRPEFLEALSKLIEAGELKTVVDSVHSFENLKDAIKVQTSGHARGKIIVEVAKE